MGSGSRLKTSEDRLWSLIEARTRPDADVAAIDARIWDLFGQEWSLMYTDLAGFSRQAGEFGILHFLQIIWEHRRLFDPIIERHDGILVKAEADSLLMLFKRPDRALSCAAEMLSVCVHVNRRRHPEEHILLCVGLGHGRLLRIGDHDVFGREVNAASKLGEDTARAGEVLATGGFVEALRRAGHVPDAEELKLSIAGCEKSFRLTVELDPQPTVIGDGPTEPPR